MSELVVGYQQVIRTDRLALVPLSVEVARTTIEDRAELERLLGAHVPPEWPQPDYAEVLPAIAETLQEDPAKGIWGRLIVHEADRTLIGDTGFIAPPDKAGAVELGYSIIPSYQDKGYATEAARAIVDWAFTQPGITKVTAECLSDNLASIRVLEKLGMRRVKEEDGMLKWELHSTGEGVR